MKANKIAAIERFFKTENKHWNEFAFKFFCELVKQERFDDIEIPLRLLSNAIDLFNEHNASPINAVRLFTIEIDKLKLSNNQKIFIYEWTADYLEESDFEEINLEPIKSLLDCKIENLRLENLPVQHLTKNLREILKEIMQKELEGLPETLKTLDSVQRLNVLCRLIPYVLPKVENVSHELGEPDEFKIKTYF